MYENTVTVRFPYPEDYERWGDEIELVIVHDSRYTTLEMTDDVYDVTAIDDLAPAEEIAPDDEETVPCGTCGAPLPVSQAWRHRFWCLGKEGE